MNNRTEMCTLNYATPREQEPFPVNHILATSLPDGRPWMAFYRSATGYTVRFFELVDFEISADGTEITVFATPGTTNATISHLFQNQALPLALSLRKELVLHGSAIEINDRAIAFLGESKRGKSTLAASFASSGFRFLTDDSLFVNRENGTYIIRPGHPSIRLWDDSSKAFTFNACRQMTTNGYNSKAMFLVDDESRFCPEDRLLGNIYFLGDGSSRDITIEPLSAQQSVIQMIRHSFLLGVDEHEMLKQNFLQLTELSRLPIFFWLDYPRRYNVLSRVQEAILKHSHVH